MPGYRGGRKDDDLARLPRGIHREVERRDVRRPDPRHEIARVAHQGVIRAGSSAVRRVGAQQVRSSRCRGSAPGSCRRPAPRSKLARARSGCASYASTGETDCSASATSASSMSEPPRAGGESRRRRGRASRRRSMRTTIEWRDPMALGAASGCAQARPRRQRCQGARERVARAGARDDPVVARDLAFGREPAHDEPRGGVERDERLRDARERIRPHVVAAQVRDLVDDDRLHGIRRRAARRAPPAG